MSASNNSTTTSRTQQGSRKHAWRLAAVTAGAALTVGMAAAWAGADQPPPPPASGPAGAMACPQMGGEGMGRHGGHGGHRGGPGMGAQPEGAGAMPFGGPMLQRALDDVKATDAQRQQIKAIEDKTRKDLDSLHDEGRKLHEDGLALWGAAKLDDKAILAHRQKMEALHARMSQRMTQAFLDTAKVLTPEQRASLVQRVRDHQGMGEHMREHMKGGMGWGRPPADGASAPEGRPQPPQAPASR